MTRRPTSEAATSCKSSDRQRCLFACVSRSRSHKSVRAAWVFESRHPLGSSHHARKISDPSSPGGVNVADRCPFETEARRLTIISFLALGISRVRNTYVERKIEESFLEPVTRGHPPHFGFEMSAQQVRSAVGGVPWATHHSFITLRIICTSRPIRRGVCDRYPRRP